MIKLPTVTVPAHYSFLPCLHPDEIEYTCDTYELTITVADNGDFIVRGKEDNVLSFVEEICIDDEESVEDIMDTVRYT